MRVRAGVPNYVLIRDSPRHSTGMAKIRSRADLVILNTSPADKGRRTALQA